MTTFNIFANQHNEPNGGICREHALCDYMGVDKVHHDNIDYRTASDISAYGMNISVKASAFTLMSGTLCEGKTDFEDIWNLFANTTHSDTFAYITIDFQVYMMNLSEFGQFVHMFCRTERDSEKNGGAMKIRCRKESKKMVQWLNAQVA